MVYNSYRDVIFMKKKKKEGKNTYLPPLHQPHRAQSFSRRRIRGMERGGSWRGGAHRL